jgi:hypothetical protein
MNKALYFFFACLTLFPIQDCKKNFEKEENSKNMKEGNQKGSFSYDLNFLKNHQDVIVLSGNNDQSQLIICPGWQGRIMTSSAEGMNGMSLGWINYDLIKSRTFQPHINVFGGEDRFWIGPEGGQYSIFFKKGSHFDIDHWQTPSPIDTESFKINEEEKDRVSFSKEINLENYQGTKFNLLVNREVRLLNKEEIKKALQTDPGNLKNVSFQSKNSITNTGNVAWSKSSGLLSIWILGMFPASKNTHVVIPYKGFSKERIVNDNYFGKLSKERLSIHPHTIYFQADGQYRSKIGLPQENADSVLGSYDADRKLLTVIKYSLPKMPHDYVNSLWEIQKFPYRGDVINAYNDGPSQKGAKGLGNFYEIETSSPAVELKPKESLTHIHTTFHFYGEETELSRLSKKIFGAELGEIKNAFK